MKWLCICVVVSSYSWFKCYFILYDRTQDAMRACTSASWLYSWLSLNGHLYKTDTFVKRTPRVGPCLFYSLYLILYKTDTSLRRTLSAGPKGVRLRESWPYCQIFILAERTRNDLPISPTHSGVTTSNTQNKPTSNKLARRIFSLTSCITYGYFSHLKLPCVAVAQSANPSI